MFCIRKATKADICGLSEVHLQCWQESYPGIIPTDILNNLELEKYIESWKAAFENNSQTSVFVAVQGKSIVGLAASGQQRDENLHVRYPGEFYAVYVLKNSQRNKVGLHLMDAMCKDLINKQLSAATLWVLEDNLNARKFYEKMGGLKGGIKEISFHGINKTEIFYFWDDLKTLQSILENTEQ